MLLGKADHKLAHKRLVVGVPPPKQRVPTQQPGHDPCRLVVTAGSVDGRRPRR
jgi:hypothetical protein